MIVCQELVSGICIVNEYDILCLMLPLCLLLVSFCGSLESLDIIQFFKSGTQPSNLC